MEIINSSKELTKAERYYLTKAQNIKKMSLVKNQRIDLAMWCLYEDTNMDGEVQTIFSCQTPEGETYATNSPSFVRCFNDILECFDAGDIKALRIEPSTSKAGREFLTCVYAE